jgi:hypothetical protein
MSATLVRVISGAVRLIIVSALFFGTLFITLAAFTAGMANEIPMVLAILIASYLRGFACGPYTHRGGGGIRMMNSTLGESRP